MKKIPITKNGFEKLKNELENLKKNERFRIIDEIKKAREFGDLKENAEYKSAKEEQIMIEKKIKKIEYILINSNIIDIKDIKNKNLIYFGATINLINISENKKISYKLVGEYESDINKNKISIKSPLAKALIQKKENEIIKFNGKKYKIEKIKYI